MPAETAPATASRFPMGLLGGGFDFSNANEDEFNDWYDTEHLAERLRIPGFVNGVRWIGADNPRLSLAIYDLDSLAVLQKPEYRAVSPENFSPWAKRMLLGKCTRVCRFNCEQMGRGDQVAPDAAGGLLVYAMNVVPEAEAEFNEWYDTEHLPRLAAVPGAMLARRFRSVAPGIAGAGAHKYVAVYHLTTADVCKSPAWKEAAMTSWTKKMLGQCRDVLALRLSRYRRAG
jgi:hypothetical protein